MLLLLPVVPASATEPEIWDDTRTGSLTLIKYDEDTWLESNSGLTQSELAAYLQQHPDTLIPEAGVVFRYLKAGEMVQYTQDNTVKTGYVLTADAAVFLKLTATDAAATVDDAAIYDVSALDARLKCKTASETERFMEQQHAASMPPTDETGTAKADRLSLGLYLVCEYSYDAAAVADPDHSAPFLVSIPSTDRGADGTCRWVYDLTIAPKNQIEPLRNDLVIVDPSGNETREYDAELQKSTQYLIRSDVPNAIGKLKTYQIAVDLAPGITWEPDTALVYGVTDEGGRTLLEAGTDFTVTGEQELLFAFAPVSLADAEGWARYDSVEIYYKAHLNQNAVIGGEGNPTRMRTNYSKRANASGQDALETLEAPAPVRVFTYAIHLHKIGLDTKAGLADVVFELQDESGDPIPVAVAADGEYYLATDGTAKLTTDQDGSITLKGVEAGTYYVKEISTHQHYQLLGERVEIQITSNELEYSRSDTGTLILADHAAVYYTDSYPGYNYYLLPLLYGTESTVPDGTYVSTGATAVMTEPDGQQQIMYSPEALQWSCNYAMESGVVQIEITNAPRPSFPQTGDNSHALLAAVSLCIAGGGLIVLKYLKHKTKDK